MSFPYREDLVSLIRAIPGRRWDRGSKVWKVPLEAVEDTVKIFMSYGFSLSPQVATTLATGGKDTGPRSLKLEAVEMTSQSLTVSALNLRVAEVLSQNFKESTWLIGELQNFDKSKRGRHKYFELVEHYEDELGEEHQRAVVSAVIFEKSMSIIRQRLAQSRNALKLEDGVKIRVRGKVELYQARGKYQFIIEDIDPAYTLGELVIKREKILADLTLAGIQEKNLSLEMPLVPLRIGLLTSDDSDAFNDFIQTLATTHFNFNVTIYPVFVQGEQLRSSMLKGLRFLAKEHERFDLCVIIRGGGSRSDLGWFDDAKVARAVAKLPLKVLIGIGHERDQCVLDLIALGVKTPTAAAELICERVQRYQQHVEDTMIEITVRAEAILKEERRRLRQRGLHLGLAVRASLAGARSTLVEAGRRLVRGSLGYVRDRGRVLSRQTMRMRVASDRLVQSRRLELQNNSRELRLVLSRRFTKETERLKFYEVRCRAHDPERVLARGYALLRSPSGQILRSVKNTKVGESLEARLADGKLELSVSAVKP